MAPPTWLPPLNSHDPYNIYIVAAEIKRPENNPPSTAVPSFAIRLKISALFVSPPYDWNLEGLSLDQELPLIPCSKLTCSSPAEAERIILAKLSDSNLLIPFELKRHVQWFEQYLGRSILGIGLSAKDYWIENLQNFLRGMKSRSYNAGHNVLPLQLRIKKGVHVPQSQFSAWRSWYEDRQRVDPDFEHDYKAAISRMRTSEELLYEATPRTNEELLQAATTSNFSELSIEDASAAAALKDESSSSSNIQCLICREELFPRSRVNISLPCNHLFHQSCVVSWIRKTHTCPLCGFKLASDYLCLVFTRSC